MAEYRKDNGYYRRIAQRLIKEHPKLNMVRESMAKICYLISDEEKKKNKKLIYADCRKVDEMYKLLTGYDFIITFYEPTCTDLTKEQERILVYHELRHIGVEDNGDFYIVPHDIEDFEDIIVNYGLHWVGGA